MSFFKLKGRLRMLQAAVAMVAGVLLLVGCGDDGDGDRKLRGTSWVRTYKATGTYATSMTYTYYFRSADEGYYNQRGWGTTSSGKHNYDTTTDFTYIYSDDIKQGVMYGSNGNEIVFSISSDNTYLCPSNLYASCGESARYYKQ